MLYRRYKKKKKNGYPGMLTIRRRTPRNRWACRVERDPGSGAGAGGQEPPDGSRRQGPGPRRPRRQRQRQRRHDPTATDPGGCRSRPRRRSYRPQPPASETSRRSWTPASAGWAPLLPSSRPRYYGHLRVPFLPRATSPIFPDLHFTFPRRSTPLLSAPLLFHTQIVPLNSNTKSFLTRNVVSLFHKLSTRSTSTIHTTELSTLCTTLLVYSRQRNTFVFSSTNRRFNFFFVFNLAPRQIAYSHCTGTLSSAIRRIVVCIVNYCCHSLDNRNSSNDIVSFRYIVDTINTVFYSVQSE